MLRSYRHHLRIFLYHIFQCYPLQLVLDSLKEGEDYMTVNEVAKSSGLAYQTVYRYLQYLIQNKKVEMVSIYGKVGRPRQLFRRTPGN